MNVNNESLETKFKTIADILYGGNKSALGRALQMSPQALNSYIKGDRAPGFEIQTKINAIGVNINWFIHGSGDMFDPFTLPGDKQFKRLFILRHRSQVFNGTVRIAARKLKIDEELYRNWEIGLKEIPSSVVDKIYSMVENHIRKEWWYEGEGDIYLPGVGLPEMNEGQVEYYPVTSVDPGLTKDIQDCISEMVNREAKHDREIFGELLKIKLREAGVLN